MVFVIIVATKDNQLVFRDVCGSCNQPFHVVSFAAVRNMGAGRFRETVNGGLRGNPLFSKEKDAVIRDDKGLAVEIGGLQMGGEVGMVFIREPNGIHFKCFALQELLVDSINTKVPPASCVVAHVAEVQVKAVLGDFLCVLIFDSLETKGF